MQLVGGAVLLFGSEQQKSKYLPEVARGESCFCLGTANPTPAQTWLPSKRGL